MIDRILPTTGWICIATALPTGGFRHRFFQEIEDAEAYIAAQDARGETVYFAQSSFKTKDNRTQANVEAVKSFWLDIDCGPTKPYLTQKDGFIALRDFCVTTKLPMPVVVNSGNGLYAHWLISTDMLPGQWRAAAMLLKELTTGCGFAVDDSRTSDSSSVLRPIGSHNKKDKANPKPVRLLSDSKEIPYESFVQTLQAAAKKMQIKSRAFDAPRQKSLNADYMVQTTGPAAHPRLIKERCQQIGYIAKNQELVDEPLWYAMIGLLVHCENGDETIHAWSENHPDYDIDNTDAKIAQRRSKDIGPTRCSTFGSLNPHACLGCKFKDKLASPIQLGREYTQVAPTLPDTTEATKIVMPEHFKITTAGIICTMGEEELPVYQYELYVTELAWDESVGYETATIKHKLPREGWKEFKVRSSLTNDPKTFFMTLADNHVQVTGADNKKRMLMYVEGYMDTLRKNREMAKLYCQMGWKDDGRFVLGKNVIMASGRVEPVSLARSVPASVEAFHTAGSLAPWVEATKIFSNKGMEAHAFAFLAGAFAAPLMKFTGFSGAMVAMLGPSGAGKTLTGMWALSAYGQPDRLMMLKDDTKNALISRLGTYGNLPLYIDEITNIDGMELSELVYRVTQGRDKMRLNRDARERTVNNTWNTLALASSNSSIVDRLSSLKLDATAEICRVVEFPVRNNDALDRATCTSIYRMLTNNYGNVGVEYLKYLAAHADQHQEKIDQLSRFIDKATGATNEERFWSAVVATTIYGGMVAKKLGLVEFEIQPILAWAQRTIISMRATKREVTNDAAGILGRFLDVHVQNRLTVNSKNSVANELRGPLHVRMETHTNRLYIGRAYFREWLSKNHGSYTAVKGELEASGALISTNQRKALGGGTCYSGPAQPCIVLNLAHPALGMVMAALVDDLEKARECEVSV